jgi:hypothetical protein
MRPRRERGRSSARPRSRWRARGAPRSRGATPRTRAPAARSGVPRGLAAIVVLLRPARLRRRVPHAREPVAATPGGRQQVRAAEGAGAGEERPDRRRRGAVVHRRLVLVRGAQPAHPGAPHLERPGARGELRAQEEVEAALGAAAVAHVIRRPPECEQQPHRPRRHVVVDRRPGDDGREPPRQRPVLDRHLGEPAARRELDGEEEIARPARGREIVGAPEEPVPRQEPEPALGRARAPEHDHVPAGEPERRRDRFGPREPERVRPRPRARRAPERPPAQPLERDQRVQVHAQLVARLRSADRDRGDEAREHRRRDCPRAAAARGGRQAATCNAARARGHGRPPRPAPARVRRGPGAEPAPPLPRTDAPPHAPKRRPRRASAPAP